MAEPIVRSFVIDTTESEQNLKELNVQINATSTAIDGSAQSFENVAAAEQEVVTSSKSLKAQLRELQAQLANTEPDSAKYRELSAAAGELKDKIQDAAQAVGTLPILTLKVRLKVRSYLLRTSQILSRGILLKVFKV